MWSQGEENKNRVWKLEEKLCGQLSDTNWFCCPGMENRATGLLDPWLHLQVIDSLAVRDEAQAKAGGQAEVRTGGEVCLVARMLQTSEARGAGRG